jgi:hypothetical protein
MVDACMPEARNYCTWLLLRPLLAASISFSLSLGYLNETPDCIKHRWHQQVSCAKCSS